MTDTPEHIKDLHLKIWLSRAPGERLYQFIMDNDAMYKALREFKIRNSLPLGDLDPVGEYLKKKAIKKKQAERQENKKVSNE